MSASCLIVQFLQTTETATANMIAGPNKSRPYLFVVHFISFFNGHTGSESYGRVQAELLSARCASLCLDERARVISSFHFISNALCQ